MGTIKITVGNSYLHGIQEEFICSNVDIADLDEVDYCVSECVGQFLENHEDIFNQLDISYDKRVDSCCYIIEEVFPDEF